MCLIYAPFVVTPARIDRDPLPLLLESGVRFQEPSAIFCNKTDQATEKLSLSRRGRHVSPREFHTLLQQAEGRLRQKQGHTLSTAASVGGRDSSSSPLKATPGREVGGSEEDVEFQHDWEGKVEQERGPDETGRGNGEVSPGEVEKETVLLDVRNVYETSIGHFRCNGFFIPNAIWLLSFFTGYDLAHVLGLWGGLRYACEVVAGSAFSLCIFLYNIFT